MKLVVNNSFCKVVGEIHPDVLDLLKQVMTYKNDIEAERGQLFFQMKMAKRNNNHKQYYATKAALEKLEQNEYVCLYKNDTFPTGLLNIAVEALNAFNVVYEMDDRRESPGQTAILRWNNAPWEPRYYQKEAIEIGLKAGRGVFECAVGSGKSLIMAYLIKELSVKSLVIVPSRGLSSQLYNDFSEWFGSQNVELLDAQKIRKLKRPKAISIVTVQSLGSLQKSGEFSEFASHIDAVFVDEVHHAGASTYTSLLTDLQHVYYRYGFSGTFLRNDNKTLEMWSFLSNVLYEFPAHRAISEGYLTPMQVRTYTLGGRPNVKYQTEYDNAYSANPELLDKLQEICMNHYGTQILILVSKKDKVGHIIYEYLNSLGVDVSYVNGDNTKETITKTIEDFNCKKIKVLVGSSVISEGIDIRSTDVLVNCKGGKSAIDLVQSIGRLIRKYEGKHIGIYYDFNFEGTKYLSKHYEDRLECIVDSFKPEELYEL